MSRHTAEGRSSSRCGLRHARRGVLEGATTEQHNDDDSSSGSNNSGRRQLRHDNIYHDELSGGHHPCGNDRHDDRVLHHYVCDVPDDSIPDSVGRLLRRGDDDDDDDDDSDDGDDGLIASVECANDLGRGVYTDLDLRAVSSTSTRGTISTIQHVDAVSPGGQFQGPTEYFGLGAAELQDTVGSLVLRCDS